MPIYDGVTGGWKNPGDGIIKNLLNQSRCVAVVGISPDPNRPSFRVSEYLLKCGYRVIPVNPSEKVILGQKAYPDLGSIPEKAEIVGVFRRPEAAVDLVKEAIAISSGAVWLQESIVSYDAFKIGEEAGLVMIMDRCMFKEHSRLLGKKGGN